MKLGRPVLSDPAAPPRLLSPEAQLSELAAAVASSHEGEARRLGQRSLKGCVSQVMALLEASSSSSEQLGDNFCSSSPLSALEIVAKAPECASLASGCALVV
jgi:hypothetical protein